MKLSELEIGKEYAVVPSWTYNSRSARDINNVRENDVLKATLISKDKYEYEPSLRKANPTDFTLAQDGNRSVGVLVKAIDNSGAEVYWTTRLADVVAVYSDLEPKWQAEKQAEAERDREANERREKLEKYQQQVRAEVERSRNSVVVTTKELLGANADVEVSTKGYQFEEKGMVSISLSEFEKLIEMAYAGKENY